MRDLLTDEKFSRADLITLQDPAHPEKWDVSSFHYVKARDAKGIHGNLMGVCILSCFCCCFCKEEQQAGISSVVRHMNPETKATLEALVEEYPPEEV